MGVGRTRQTSFNEESIKSLATALSVALFTRRSGINVPRHKERAAMAPSPEARKDRWKIVFQKAWDVVKEDVDMGGGETLGEGTAGDGTGNDGSGKQMV